MPLTRQRPILGAALFAMLMLAMSGGAGAAEVILYDLFDFEGESRTLTDSAPDLTTLGFDNDVESIRVISGTWSFHRDDDFQNNNGPPLELAGFVRVVLQHALARRIADRAVERVVQQQELDHGATRLPCFDAVGAHHHAVLHLLHAGRQRLRRARHVHQTHAALSRRAQSRVPAVARDDDADPLGRMQDRGALGYRDLGAIDRDVDQLALAIHRPS